MTTGNNNCHQVSKKDIFFYLHKNHILDHIHKI